jgi:hypothetical protein
VISEWKWNGQSKKQQKFCRKSNFCGSATKTNPPPQKKKEKRKPRESGAL